MHPSPVLITLGLLAAAHTARAEEDPALYQATAIVTGTDMRQRPLGFAETLTEVLVKLSGAPQLAHDPALAPVTDHAADLVAAYTYVDPRAGRLHYDDQGTYDRSQELTVRFDPAKTEAALTALGHTVWHGPRPLLLPVIVVRTREPIPFMLTAETPRGLDLRAAAIRLAAADGIGIHFPTEADLAEWAVTPIGFPAPLTHPDPSRLLVAGSLGWDVHAMGWIGVWRATLNGTEHNWTIRGVGFDQALATLIDGAVTLAAGTGAPD